MHNAFIYIIGENEILSYTNMKYFFFTCYFYIIDHVID